MSEMSANFASESSSADALFQLNEIIYSRSDERGVIQSGNAAFLRVAGYEWDKLIGEQHKLVRHPEMPKAVFHLLWKRIREGLATGVYVKNLRSCGRYYWVLALVTPTEGGYISTHIKPTSKVHRKVMDIYADLLKQEGEGGLSPAEGTDAFLAALRAQGYENYDAFQSIALAEEFECRARQMNHPVGQVQKRFLDMSRSISEVRAETTEMTEAFKAIRTVPMNMRIIASRLENAGGPISAISVNYSQMLEEMSTWVNTFVEGEKCVFARIRNAILAGQFQGMASAVEQETLDGFDDASADLPDGIDAAVERGRLIEGRKKFVEQTKLSVTNVDSEAKRFARSVLDMKRYVTGLSSTRMMCKIESAALSGSDTALSGIVEQLDDCQDEIERRLARIVELNSVIQANTAVLHSLIS